MIRFPLSSTAHSRTLRFSASAAALLAALSARPAIASPPLPIGGNVAAGSAVISAPSNGAMTITQSTNNAVINWTSFDVGAGNSVTFAQPSAASATLNRITGDTPSTIAGQINSNGSVYLINPNGIEITKSGVVSVGRVFVASTLDISNTDFMSGNGVFRGNGGLINNAGTITAGPSGYVGLLGGSVVNSGTIIAPAGQVVIGAGRQATLDLNGGGFLQVTLPTSAGLSDDGSFAALTPAAARAAIRNIVNLPANINAQSVTARGELIAFGDVSLSGSIAAAGGSIIVSSPGAISLTNAHLDTSSATSGGTIKIGGDLHGGGSLIHATLLSVDATSTVTANATALGNGGNVVLWSDKATNFGGAISATGGTASGDGGNAEVSSHGTLDYTGNTTLTTVHGQTGTLLLDPYDVIIATGTDTAGFSYSSVNGSFTAPASTSVLTPATLQAALAIANVTVTTGAAGSPGSQAGDITVASPITWNSANSLTLSAYRNVYVNAAITNTSGAAIALNADNSGTGIGTVSFGGGAQVSTSGAVNIYYNPAGNPGSSTSVNALTYTTPDNYSADVAGGATLTAYMLVNTVFDLQNMQNNLSGNYALGTNIDASVTSTWNNGAGFVPVGTTGDPSLVGTALPSFNGNFDGQSHTINNLYINSNTLLYVGLFGAFDPFNGTTTTIKNVGLVGGSITATAPAAFANFSGSFNFGPAISVGALVGSSNGIIMNSYSSAMVNGINALNNQNVETAAGGLVGYDQTFPSPQGQITNSHATGAVTTTMSCAYCYAGGLVGLADDGDLGGSSSVDKSYATGNVSGYTAGGLIGYDGTSVTQSYATGAVTGNTNVGGLAGLLFGEDNTMDQSYASGSVNGVTAVGGLVGAATGGFYGSSTSISHSYATGSVTGTQNVGGLVGSAFDLAITQSYAVGKVTGTALTGGLVGSNTGDSADYEAVTITSSNWDVSATGQTVAVGGTDNNGQIVLTQVNGYTTAQLQNPATASSVYAGWDFTNTWVTPAPGYYPTLTSLTNFLTVTANNATRAYGAANPGFTASYSGLLAGDTVSTPPSFTTTATPTSNVGQYVITASNAAISGPDASTYRITYVPGTLTITTAPLTIVGVTADSISKLYGAPLPSLTYTATGLLNGDTLSGALATTATQASPVGSYAITQGSLSAGSNYSLNFTPGTLSVTPAPLSVTYTATAASRTYGGSNPVLTGSVSATGLVNGDTLEGVTSGSASFTTNANATSNVGSYAVNGSGLSGSSTNYSYRFVQASGNASALTIDPANLNVMAISASGVYGSALAPLSYIATGLVNGDKLSGALATTASPTASVGSYAINQGTLAASPNYSLSFASATYTITPASLAVTANAQSRVYGAANPSLTFVATGLLNGDTLSGALATTAAPTSNVGNYAITQGTLGNSNYTIAFTDANLSVTAATLTYVATPGQRFANTPNPLFTGTVTGFVLTDTLTSATSGTLLFSSPATIASPPGNYAILGSGLTANNGNYVFVQALSNATALKVNANSIFGSWTVSQPDMTTNDATSNVSSIKSLSATSDVAETNIVIQTGATPLGPSKSLRSSLCVAANLGRVATCLPH